MTAARSARAGRHRARVAALQLLYQQEIGRAGGAEAAEAVSRYWMEYPAPADRRAFATSLVEGTLADLDRIDRLIGEVSANWRLSRMAVVDRLVLRLGTHELLRGDTPPAVVLDEAIELARAFGGDESARFVNGVLDGVKRRLETGAAGEADPAARGGPGNRAGAGVRGPES